LGGRAAPVIAGTVSAVGWSLLVAFAASALGALSFWNYLRQHLHFPLSAIAVYLFVPSAAIALAVLLFRCFFRRGQVWLAVLAFPSLIVAYEYLVQELRRNAGRCVCAHACTFVRRALRSP
jgi:hypothetical protein